MQNRGILITLRAAAVVIIATGLNDVLAGALPRYEPLWLYLAAVALVALLDGVILGGITALVAVAFYALLFMSRADAFSARIAIPLGAALGVAIIASIVRGLVRARRRPPETIFPAMPPLIETSEVARVVDNTEVLSAIDELRTELRTAVADLTTSRSREGQLESEREWAMKLAEESRIRAEQAAATVADTERALTEAREESSTMAGRLAELELSLHEAERSRTELALERSRADAEKGLREHLERELVTLREQAAWIPGLESERAALTGRLTDAVSRVAELERKLAGERAAVTSRVAELERLLAEERAAHERVATERGELTSRIAEIERKSGEATVAAHMHAAQEAQRAEQALARVAELETALGEERAAREAAHSRIAEIERTLAEERAAHDHVATERGELTSRIADLERTLTQERATRERLESEAAQFDTKLQTIASHLASDHEADLGQAVAEREEARAEARRLRARISELEAAVTEERAAREQERSDAAARVAELESALTQERATRERLESDTAQFDTKLQTIVTHLASDHEADLGQALGEKEEARAEARSLSMKLATLQRKLDEEREGREALEALLTETRTAAQAEINRLRATPPPPPSTRPRVLIVHPDPELRGNASTTLARAGYEVLGAADGLEALRVAIAQQPEVVIAEGSMPKMDGRELCQLLKSQEKTAHIRVILLMRASDEAPRGDLVPDEVLRKPVPVETLKSTLASLLAPHTR